MGVSKRIAACGLDNLRRLGEAGITTHIQIVLCPGINDGTQLRNTVSRLAEDFPAVASIGVVPVSVSREFMKARPQAGIHPCTSTGSAAVIEDVEALQASYGEKSGSRLVYAADEFYLLAALPLPAPAAYDGYPQYENGIGIAASFLENLGSLEDRIRSGPPGTDYLLTGVLAAPVVESACKTLAGSGPAVLKPLVARNQLFGAHVTVTGLLGGRDVLAAARDAGLGRMDRLLLPAACITGSDHPRFLDGITLEELHESLSAEVIPITPL